MGGKHNPLQVCLLLFFIVNNKTHIFQNFIGGKSQISLLYFIKSGKNTFILIIFQSFTGGNCPLPGSAHECDDKIVEVYLSSVHSFLLNVPWDCLDEIFYDHNADKNCKTGNGSENEPRVLFLGNFIQFLCSLTEQVCSMETLGETLDKQVMISKIVDLVPKLLCWCLDNRGDCVSAHFRISRYLKHKLLVLMIRLSCLDPSILLSWLKFLHSYFEGYICKPIIAVVDGLQCLDDSPFSSSILYREFNNSSHYLHIQRQAVFLFLRCSISLNNLKGENEMHSAYSPACQCL